MKMQDVMPLRWPSGRGALVLRSTLGFQVVRGFDSRCCLSPFNCMVARCISQVKVIIILQPEGTAWISGCDSRAGEEKCRRQSESNLSTALETRSKWIPWWQYKATGKAKKKEMGRQGNTAAAARVAADNTEREQ